MAEALERETDFDRLAARGTLRLALRALGFDVRAGTAELLKVVTQTLARELSSRGVEQAEVVCQRLRLVVLEHGAGADASGAGEPAPERSRKERR
ncbi:MAG: hypothetical protein QNK04_16000 [Myxococcota bacterium]|nr:hypothetical protein [Myxococcota bacterium]